MVVLLRVDDRLIHGMVAVSWTSQLKPDIIAVVNDAASADSFQSMTLKLAKPAGVDLYIWGIDEAVQKLNDRRVISKKVFLVTQNMEDTLNLCEKYKLIPAVNIGIGGLSKTADMKPVLPEIFMGPNEYETSRKIHDMGIDVFAQLIPTKPKVSFEELTKMFTKQIN